MKLRLFVLLAAALAAFFMLMVLAVAVNASEPDVPLDGEPADDTCLTDQPCDEPDGPPENGTERPESYVPPGTGTVIDYYIDAEGKVFYTIMTEDKFVFYLIIDQDKNTQNVYFLNAVTIADLAALAEFPLPIQDGACDCPPTPTDITPPDTTLEPNNGSGSSGIIFFGIGVMVIAAFGMWYFKVFRAKQKQIVRSLEYTPAATEEETRDDYSENWDEDVTDANADDETEDN